jgi:hypothetical protein
MDMATFAPVAEQPEVAEARAKLRSALITGDESAQALIEVTDRFRNGDATRGEVEEAQDARDRAALNLKRQQAASDDVIAATRRRVEADLLVIYRRHLIEMFATLTKVARPAVETVRRDEELMQRILGPSDSQARFAPAFAVLMSPTPDCDEPALERCIRMATELGLAK